jgi:hypothetical protein
MAPRHAIYTSPLPVKSIPAEADCKSQFFRNSVQGEQAVAAADGSSPVAAGGRQNLSALFEKEKKFIC